MAVVTFELSFTMGIVRGRPHSMRPAHIRIRAERGRYVRGHAFNLSLLASALAAQGEPDQACLVGLEALSLTTRLTSARSVRYVRAGPRTPARRSRAYCTPMIVIAPRISPLAIIVGVSSSWIHRISAV
jgi:hypothetical protein